MHTCEFTKKALEEQIVELNKVLKELQYNQTEEIILLQKNQTNYKNTTKYLI